ncbi:MAG TPA: CbiX/SirB N-terminal domain-containing protein, partial [Roseiflexaceae bacterium]|nr:CbiX/SirB N-terminal domain-containing protein [Roseiflexaceae bacterium]
MTASNQASSSPSAAVTHVVSNSGSPRALLLVAHGSRRRGSAAALVRLAERTRSLGIAPIVEVAFLEHARPSVGEALARCRAAGADEIVVLPYFLTYSVFVRETLPRMVAAAQASYPDVAVRLTKPLGNHPALAQLLLKRAVEADYLASHTHILRPGAPRPLDDGANWRPLPTLHPTGLLIIAHGSPEPRTNAPIFRLAREARAASRYASVVVGFMQ